MDGSEYLNHMYLNTDYVNKKLSYGTGLIDLYGFRTWFVMPPVCCAQLFSPMQSDIFYPKYTIHMEAVFDRYKFVEESACKICAF